jgi:hypothetical protein
MVAQPALVLCIYWSGDSLGATLRGLMDDLAGGSRAIGCISVPIHSPVVTILTQRSRIWSATVGKH